MKSCDGKWWLAVYIIYNYCCTIVVIIVVWTEDGITSEAMGETKDVSAIATFWLFCLLKEFDHTSNSDNKIDFYCKLNGFSQNTYVYWIDSVDLFDWPVRSQKGQKCWRFSELSECLDNEDRTICSSSLNDGGVLEWITKNIRLPNRWAGSRWMLEQIFVSYL